MHKRLASIAMLVVAVMAMMSPAFADSGSGEKPPEIKPDVKSDPRDPIVDPASLPFTGSELTGYVVVGALTMGAGTVLVRRTRTRLEQR